MWAILSLLLLFNSIWAVNYELVIVIERLAVIVAPALSVTWTATLNVPAAAGVPDITPAFRANPPGSEPVIAQL